jgi:hypothetical protein
MKGLKRTLVRGAVFVLLGAMVNIVVAWLLALRLPPGLGSTESIQSSTECFSVYAQFQVGDVRLCALTPSFASWFRPVTWGELAEALPHASRFRDADWVNNHVRAGAAASQIQLMEHLHGWPLLSMSGWAVATFASTAAAAAPPQVEWHGLYEIGPLPGMPTFFRVFLIRPLWPGFLLNTLFYAAILAALFFVPVQVRRTLRRRRGRCIACNYDRRGFPDAPCPECGHCEACGGLS